MTDARDAQEDKAELAGSDTQAPPAPPAQASTVPTTRPSSWCSGAGLCVRYAGRSAVGLVREHNEDNFVIVNLSSGEVSARESSLVDVVTQGGLLFAVCDGMGGAAAGEVASQMAVDVLHEEMRRGGPPRERDELARRLVGAWARPPRWPCWSIKCCLSRKWATAVRICCEVARSNS
jgi:hypothetical protein